MKSLTRQRTSAALGAIILAGAAMVSLSACGGPPMGLQQQSQQSGAIPPGAVVTGGTVGQNQTNGWFGQTGGSAELGK
jgi:hypothetical protein